MPLLLSPSATVAAALDDEGPAWAIVRMQPVLGQAKRCRKIGPRSLEVVNSMRYGKTRLIRGQREVVRSDALEGAILTSSVDAANFVSLFFDFGFPSNTK